MITVRFKPTGELGTIPDNEYDPNIYEVADSPISQPQTTTQPQTPIVPSPQVSTAPNMNAPQLAQPQSKGILRSVADFVAPKLTDIGSAAWNTAGMAKDYIDYNNATTPERKQLEAKSYTERRRKANDSLKRFGFDADKSGNQFDATKYAKGTFQGALEAASFAVPAGKTYKAAAGLGAISGGLRSLSEVDKVSDIPSKVIEGTVGGAAGGVIAKGATDLVSGLLKKVGANMALKGLRPSKTQISKFNKITGEDLSDFVIENKLYDAGTDQVDELIKPLQAGYDELALKSGTKVTKSTIEDAFNSKIDELNKVPNTQIQSIASQLAEERDLLVKSIGDDTGINFITKTRRAIDDLIPNSKFAQDPIAAGKNRVVRDVYKKIIDDATGGKTAELGTQLSNLYAFRDIAEIQGGLGKGNLPAGLLPVLSGGFGFSQGKDINERIKNATLYSSAVWGLNNPKVIGLMSKILTGSGNMIGKSNISQPIGRILGEKAGVMLGNKEGKNDGRNNSQGPINISTNNGQGSEYDNTNNISPIATPQSVHSDSLPQSPQDVTLGSGMGETPSSLLPKYKNPYNVPPEILAREYQNSMKAGDRKTAEWIKSMYDEEIDYQMKLQQMSKKEGQPVKKTEKQQMFVNAASAAQKAYDLLDAGGVSTGIGQGFLGGIGEKTGTNSNEQQQYRSTIAVARTAARNAMLGANMTPKEMESIAAFIPEFDDAPNIAKTKLNTFIQLMNEFGMNMEGTGIDTTNTQGLGETPSMTGL